ncbi:condensation domain-containing protein, partial [Kitasatospora sp. NPDC093558]|uniref:condensation domain-containing protein n=1 Tax=Kitasatospora sp. NPDC093558 TaxID=3155201 RepID=UPI00344641E0
LVADRPSVRRLTDEVLTRYAALLDGAAEGADAASVVDLPAVFAAQRSWLESDDAEKDIEFWRSRTAALSALELPTDRPRPPVKTIEAEAVTVPVPPALHAALDGFAAATGTTLHELLLSGYVAALARHAQQQDFAVGVPVPPAWQEGAGGLVGPLENTLPLRFELEAGESLSGLLRRAESVLAEALVHARLPFEQIVEAARPARDLSHTPLFQVLFGFEEQWASRELPGAVARPLDLPTTWTPHDIDLYAVRRDGELALRAQFNTTLFDRGTAARLLDRALLLLESAIAEPDRPLADFPLLSGEEREHLAAWNATRAEHDAPRLLHELVERAAKASPEAVALTSGTAELTYASLDLRAEALAATLTAHGVGAETPIGVLADRSVHTVVALLGVLKAGGAYVPLDPSYPADRIATIAADAGIGLVVGAADALGALAAKVPAVRTLPVPTADPEGPVTRPAVHTAPDGAAVRRRPARGARRRARRGHVADDR